ncbi:beta-lactamase-like protein [Rhodofomes roseus]|uniref:Beta-lactamase-like protein n=1 Tax=Rhodofomes roseus TaxID=34475 RepID=A0ABQ8KQG4_9APHY|nr:beta-lactamase-like protein [Rhodofomes roseus]KAH9840859.1 beta-lactamase-like protein [Rhodofomes roseus]
MSTTIRLCSQLFSSYTSRAIYKKPFNISLRMYSHQDQGRRPKTMSHDITVTFLGTASGGGPTETRNCSSLVVDALGDQTLWMVDCAEGTVRQVLQQPFRGGDRVKLSRLTKVFITHMHADHTAGVLTLLRNTLGIPKARARSRSPHATQLPPALAPPTAKDQPVASSSSAQASAASHEYPQHDPEVRTDPPRIEIFGPRGLRRFLRLQMLFTHTHSQDRYAVHELLTADQTPSCPGDVPHDSDHGATEEDRLVDNEAPGQDIRCDAQGFWRGIVDEDIGSGSGWWSSSSEQKGFGKVVVDAGPIDHRDPCIGYVIRELPHLHEPAALQTPIPTPRKLVILGDTFNADALIPLIDPPSANATATASGSATRPIEVDMDVDVDSPPGDASIGIEDATVTPDVRSLIARTPVSLLIHEATDAYIPPSVDPQEKTGKNRTAEIVNVKTRDRGHSTPAMAGEFAGKIGAERLVLNHIGARFPAPPLSTRTGWERFQLACIREIEKQAHATWRPPKTRPPTYVTAAYDYYRVVIPPNRMPRSPEDERDGQRVEWDVAHRDRSRERHAERFDRREEGSQARRQTEPRYQARIEAESSNQPVDSSRKLPPRNEVPPFVRSELAQQSRERWEALAVQGSLVSEVDYSQHPALRASVAGRNVEGHGARVNDNGKRDRTVSSGDSTRGQIRGYDGGDRGGRGRDVSVRGIHTESRGGTQWRGRGNKRGRK